MLQTLCKDSILKSLIQQYGNLSFADNFMKSSGNLFVDLVHIILRQQLSNKAANSIYKRLFDYLNGNITPNGILSTLDSTFKELGISSNKVIYLKSLATHIQNNTLQLERLHDLNDTEVLNILTKVKGIGKWSGECFLMFSLKRTDIFPLVDLGIQKAIQNLYANGAKLSEKEILQIAENWRPFRSYACLYLWKSLENS